MDIDQFLATHDGVVSRAQAHACGLSDGQIRRRVRAGRWLRRAPRVFFAAAWTFTPAARVRVAAEWARPRGVLGSVTGAWWLGLPVDSPHPLTLVLDHGHTRRAPPGITVLQHDLGVDRSEHRGLPVVATPLLVLDAAVELGDRGQAFLDRALQAEHVDLDELRRAHHATSVGPGRLPRGG